MARAPCIEEHKENDGSKKDQKKKKKYSTFFFLTETKPRLERKRTPRIAKTASIFFTTRVGTQCCSCHASTSLHTRNETLRLTNKNKENNI